MFKWLRSTVEPREIVERKPYRVLLEVGDEYVRALLVELGDSAAVIIGGGCEKRSAGDGDSSVSSIARLCESALSCAEKSTEAIVGHRVIADYALVGIPVGWTTMARGDVRLTRSTPEARVSPQELKAMLSRAVGFALSTPSGSGQDPSEAEAVYWAVTDARMDGQRISDLIGFRGSSIDLSVSLTLMRRERADYLRDIAYELELDPVVLVPLVQALAACLPSAESIGVLLEHEHTDVFRTLDGRVAECQRIPDGTRQILLGVTKGLGISERDSGRLERAYSRGQLDTVATERVERELWRQMWLWAQAIRPAIQSVAEDSVPSSVYLCGTGDGLSSLKAVLATPQWKEGLRFVRNPSIATFGPQDVVPLLDRVRDPKESGALAVRCLAVHSLTESRKPSRIDGLLADVLREKGYIG